MTSNRDRETGLAGAGWAVEQEPSPVGDPACCVPLLALWAQVVSHLFYDTVIFRSLKYNAAQSLYRPSRSAVPISSVPSVPHERDPRWSKDSRGAFHPRPGINFDFLQEPFDWFECRKPFDAHILERHWIDHHLHDV